MITPDANHRGLVEDLPREEVCHPSRDEGECDVTMKKHYFHYRDFWAVAQMDVGGLYFHCKVTGPAPAFAFDFKCVTFEEVEPEFHRAVDATLASAARDGWKPNGE